MKRTLLSAARVLRYRERLGFSQTQAAKLAGWQRGQSWYKLEMRNTDARISTLVTVARVLGCGISDLLVKVPSSAEKSRRLQRTGK
jgi:transcriptional regulator with XRE-family HTH domain